jgi:hypothetical protein
MVGANDTHVIVRTRVFPAESFGAAVSCVVSDRSTVALAGVTTTEATGTGATVIAA